MIKVKLSLLLLAGSAMSGFCAGPARPGPLTADANSISPEALIEQLSSIPDYSVSLDTIPVTEADLLELEEGEDLETYLFISSVSAQAPDPVHLGGNGSLTLTRYDNGQKATVRYRRSDGTYDPDALIKLDYHMRCSLTGKQTHMSVKLLELLDAVEDRFGKSGLVLLSGYRTPKNNGKTSGASRRSLHMLGWAADIRIPGYSSTRVRNFARKKWVGGIGYYPYKGFVHLDVGKARYWAVNRPPRKKRIYRKARHTGRVAQQRRSAPVSRRVVAKPAAAKAGRSTNKTVVSSGRRQQSL